MDVRLPDGTVLQNVPEGTTQAQLAQKLAANGYDVSKLGMQPQAQAPSPSVMDKPTREDAIRASIPARFAAGMAQPMVGAGQLIANAMALGSKPGDLRYEMAQNVNNYWSDQARKQQEAAQKENVGTNVAGFLGGMASPINAIAASRLASGLRGMQAVKAGAAMGALGGATAFDPNQTPESYAAQKTKDILAGTALGAVMTPAMGGIANAVSPKVSPQAQLLIKEGITPTPGQMIGGAAQRLEDKARSLPILGDMITAGQQGSIKQFNKAALNRALSPIGESTDEIGQTGIQQVRQKLQSAYDDLLPKMSFKTDDQFTSDMGNLKQLAANLAPKEQDKFNAVMADIESKLSPNGSMTGETFKIAESKLQQEAKKFAGSNDAYQQELGGALNEALNIYRSALPRANPDMADRLSAINQGWANYSRLRQAASSAGAAGSEGVFTPAQLAQAVRSQDTSVGRRATSEGTALMQDLASAGQNVLGNKYPDSGTAGRLLLSGGALGAGALNPAVPIGLGLAGLPFVGPGKVASSILLSKRPEYAAKLASHLRQIAPVVAAGAPLAIQQQ